MPTCSTPSPTRAESAWGGKERAALIVAVLMLCAVVSLSVYSLIVRDFFSAPLARTSSVALFAVLPWVYWVSAKRSRFKNVAAVMLRYHRCPHCGYDLRMLTADRADGATICPECGSAWRLGDACERDRGDA